MPRSLAPLLLPADPTVALEAATKQYVDNKAAPEEVYVGVVQPADPKTDVWIDTSVAGTGGAGSYTLQDEGTPLTARSAMNFIGSGVYAVDDPINLRTNIVISGGGGGGGHDIQDEGVLMTAQGALNFVGAGVTVTNDAGNARTIVTIPGGGGFSQATADTLYVPLTRSVIAGNGLTGGGVLSSDATLNVVGDANLSVTADQVAVLSAPKWTTGRTITLTGDVTGVSTAFDGSAALSFVTAIGAGVIMDADVNASAAIAQSKIATLTTDLAAKVPTTRSVIAGAGMTGGGVLSADVTLNVIGDSTLTVSADSITVVSAPKWTTGRTVTLTGDVTGTSVAFDGTAALSFATAIGAGVIVDADVNASAAIAQSKIANLTTDLAAKATTSYVDTSISTHAAAANPHPVYLTQPEGDALYAGINHTHPSTTDLRWTFNSLNTMAEPSSGNIRTNTDAGTPSTQAAVSYITNTGLDASATLASLTIGDLIYFQQLDNANNWGRYTISGAPVNNTTWWLLPITAIEQHGTPIAKNQVVLVRFTYGTGGGGGGGGATEVYAQANSPAPGSTPLMWVDTDDTSIEASPVWRSWTGTQAEYDALGTYDAGTMYAVKG